MQFITQQYDSAIKTKKTIDDATTCMDLMLSENNLKKVIVLNDSIYNNILKMIALENRGVRKYGKGIAQGTCVLMEQFCIFQWELHESICDKITQNYTYTPTCKTGEK